MRLVNLPGKKKRLVELHSYFNGDLSLVSRKQTPVGIVVFPDLGRSATETRVMPLDADPGLELLTQQILPVRQRWLGIEPDAAPTACVAPHCPFVSVSAHYYEAADAFAQVLDTLHKPLGTVTR